MAIEVGRLAVKIAGRDAGKECLIIDVLNDNQVLIDGNTRRRKCNINHLEFLHKKAGIKKGASHEEVLKALAEVGVKVLERGKKFTKKKKEPKEVEVAKPKVAETIKKHLGFKKPEEAKEAEKPAKKKK